MMGREKEKEIQLESAMSTNCLILGLDSIDFVVGGSNDTPSVVVRLFHH